MKVRRVGLGVRAVVRRVKGRAKGSELARAARRQERRAVKALKVPGAARGSQGGAGCTSRELAGRTPADHVLVLCDGDVDGVGPVLFAAGPCDDALELKGVDEARRKGRENFERALRDVAAAWAWGRAWLVAWSPPSDAAVPLLCKCTHLRHTPCSSPPSPFLSPVTTTVKGQSAAGSPCSRMASPQHRTAARACWTLGYMYMAATAAAAQGGGGEEGGKMPARRLALKKTGVGPLPPKNGVE